MISNIFDKGNKRYLEQFLKFGLIGIFANFFGYLIYLLLTYIGLMPKLAVTILYGVGATISFIGNKKITFAHKGDNFPTTLKYVAIYSLGYALNIAILNVFVDQLGYAHQWVQAFAIFVVAAFLFLACKFYVFREKVR